MSSASPIPLVALPNYMCLLAQVYIDDGESVYPALEATERSNDRERCMQWTRRLQWEHPSDEYPTGRHVSPVGVLRPCSMRRYGLNVLVAQLRRRHRVPGTPLRGILGREALRSEPGTGYAAADQGFAMRAGSGSVKWPDLILGRSRSRRWTVCWTCSSYEGRSSFCRS